MDIGGNAHFNNADSAESASRRVEMPRNPLIPIVFSPVGYIPLKMRMRLIVKNPKSIEAVRHLKIGKILTDENDGENFLGNIAIVYSNDPNDCNDTDSIKSFLIEKYNGIAIEAIIKSCRKISEEEIVLEFVGLRKINLINFVQTEPFFRANFERLTEYGLGKPVMDRVRADLFTMITKLVAFDFARAAWADGCRDPKDPSALIDVIIFNSVVLLKNEGFSEEELQNLFTELNVLRRWQIVADKLSEALSLREVQRDISNKVDKVRAKQGREYVLRQQLEKIEKELDEINPQEAPDARLEELKKNIKKARMPKDAEAAAMKEFNRLKGMQQSTSEASVARTYIEWLIAVPWHYRSEEDLCPSNVQKILDEDHYDLEKVKKRIVEHIAVRKLNPDKRGIILCLVGPPGVGKTSLSQSLARATGRKLYRKSLGGVKDEAEIRGHRRTYVGAIPGFIISGMAKVGTVNPIFVLDEIDKMAHDFRGDPAAALLEVLDPEQNKAFSDHYLDVDYDLSQVMFVATANTLEGIPPTLMDRLEILHLPGYVREQKLEIAKRFLIPKQMKETGVGDYVGKEFFPDELMMRVIGNYTREAGVRTLERRICSLLSNVAVQIAETGKSPATHLTEKFLYDVFGPVEFTDGEDRDIDMPGVATGLAVDAIEGCILTIGSCKMPGHGKFEFTGNMRNVMKESAQVAFTCAKNYLKDIGMDLAFLENIDIHIQFEENAIPKDGPSAGAAIALTIISLLTGRKVRPDLALTGEITFRGKSSIMPVGGIKDKIMAAERAGKKVVFIPFRNKKDLPEIPEQIKQRIEIRLAKQLKEIVDFALL